MYMYILAIFHCIREQFTSSAIIIKSPRAKGYKGCFARVITVRERSGSFVSVQGMSKPLSKSVKSQGILSQGCRKLFYWVFSYKQGNFGSKIILAILIYVDS